MKYFIGYLIKGQAKEYQEKLIDKISEGFNVRNLNEYIPAHFTLKSPFSTNDIKHVEKILKVFCSKEKSSKIRIDSIGNFNRRVIYLGGELSLETIGTLRRLIDKLRTIPWMRFDKFDLVEDNFHSTLTRAKDSNQFKEIMNFLYKEKPDFDVDFDNIAILRREKDRWVIHKEFAIK
ncbi:MAG: 2'-5' RNA ligase family protein [Nanoarchaeota archaeon]|nr:2'-5' RNA ligase family protein [Nanoarchaeota archaeon]